MSDDKPLRVYALQEQQYKTYILSDSASGSQLEVVPERGGMITRWRFQDREILYLDSERFANPDLSVRGGIPILFPICGNLPDNTYTYKGQQYTLKQHGFARDLPWAVTDSSVKDDCASLTLVLNSNEQTRAVYPFDFQVDFTYEFRGSGLKLEQSFTNNSPEPMPFSVGLHPYFLVSDKTKLNFAIPATQFQDQRTKTTHAFAGELDLNQDEIDVAFGQLSERVATLRDQERHLKLTLEWSDAYYKTLVFWTLKVKDFYCLEPWTAPRNALNTGTDLLYLEPGDKLQMWVNMNVTFL